MYTAVPLESQRFVLSPTTLADVARAETALVRMEEQIRRERTRPALRKIIARLEAISTIRIDGKSPSLRALIELEDREHLEGSGVATAPLDRRDSAIPEGLPASLDASLEALWYMRTLEWLSENIKPGDRIDPETILEIHSRCVQGQSASQSGVAFRSHEYRVPRDLADVYQAPSPEEVLPLIEDLCVFINKDVYSPNTQAAVAHFQFESIKPFKRGLDRTGRALAHAILYRRGLVEDFIPPIGLMPAIRTKFHAEHLLPYGAGLDVEGLTKVKAIDEWVRFCAHSVELAAQVMKAYITTLVALERSWDERIGRPSKGSAVQELLLILPGSPILTVASAMRLIDRGFSATNDALARLEQAGVLVLTDGVSGRNRVFEATEVFNAIDAMERRLLTSSPIARDSFLAREVGD
jgi:hypothetical protein